MRFIQCIYLHTRKYIENWKLDELTGRHTSNTVLMFKHYFQNYVHCKTDRKFKFVMLFDKSERILQIRLF